MKPRVLIVVLVSFVIELVNFRYLTPPLDVDTPAGTPWYLQMIAFQWVLLHLAGLRSLD